MLRPAKRLIQIGLIVLALVVGYLGFTAYQVRSAAGTDDWADSGRRAEAIVVLGAAQYDGQPSPVLASRLDRALELFNDGASSTIVVTGYKQDSDRFTEAYAGLKYLMKRGVPESAVLVVDDGSNTWESLSAVKRVLAKRDVDDVIFVSSRYHNRRLQGIAGELGLSAGVSSVGAEPSRRQIFAETMRVATGQIVGFRRLSGLTS